MEQHPGRRDPLTPQDVDLLGFVLGALDPDEHARVADAVAQSPQLQEEVDRLYASLPKTEDQWGEARPPAGLARRTCERVADFDRTRDLLASLPPRGLPPRGLPPRGHQLSEDTNLSTESAWSAKDLIVAAAACLALGLLIVPAIVNSRYQAQIANCQNNLRKVAVSLHQYSDLFTGSLPSGQIGTRLGVAGAFGPLLKEAELIDDLDLICPSDPNITSRGFTVPTCRQVAAAPQSLIPRMQQNFGGSYAYTLGYVDDQTWHPPRDERRAWAVVLADTTTLDQPLGSLNHGNNGENVLFEDGHVMFVRDQRPHLVSDDRIYVNRIGQIAAGVDKEDAVVAPSFVPPTNNASYFEHFSR